MDQLGPETDIYAVASCYMKLLTGQLPLFVRDSEPDDEIKLRILLHPPNRCRITIVPIYEFGVGGDGAGAKLIYHRVQIPHNKRN